MSCKFRKLHSILKLVCLAKRTITDDLHILLFVLWLGFCSVSSEILYAVWGSPRLLLQAVIRGITNSLFLFDPLITRYLLTRLEDIRYSSWQLLNVYRRRQNRYFSLSNRSYLSHDWLFVHTVILLGDSLLTGGRERQTYSILCLLQHVFFV